MIKILAILGITSIGYIKCGDEVKHWFWKRLFSCPLCLGFWASIFIYLNPFPIIDHAFSGAFLSYFVYKFLQWLFREL